MADSGVMDIGDGDWVLCMNLMVAGDSDDVIRGESGCAQFTVETPTCYDADRDGLMKGICSVEGAGNGVSASGKPVPVPAPVDTMSGASTLLYGAALALMTVQLAF